MTIISLLRSKPAAQLMLGAPLAWILLVLIPSCAESPEPNAGASSTAAVIEAKRSDLPAEIHVADPIKKLDTMGLVEDYSEAVADRFIEFSDKLRRRDFSAARDWISADFAGHSIAGLPENKHEVLPLGTIQSSADVSAPSIVNRTGFLEGLKQLVSPWHRVENVLWKVKGADFETGLPVWGKVHFFVTILGIGSEGDPCSVAAWGSSRVELHDGNWMLASFALESYTQLSRSKPLFTDVATSTGVAHAGIRFGKPGNQSFAWNGAAGGDVNGDGLWDLFVPSLPNNFLYLGQRDAQGNLTFREEALARGVQQPAGGTGAVFFDYDNDGDQDLALADVGWETGGNRLRLWENDGSGKFSERGKALGFDALTHGYTLVTFDADSDGFLDLYVCNYGRVSVNPNNSWVQATNGTRDLFFHNQAGQGFKEASAEFGFGDDGWSYAAAAADYDNDGDVDLYVANDYGKNQLWINTGGKFVDRALELGVLDLGNGMGASAGDMNNDGIVDLYVSNMSSTAGTRILRRLKGQQDATTKNLYKLAQGNTVFIANGPEQLAYEARPKQAGGVGANWAWTPVLADLDLDGLLDVHCVNGFVTGDTAADT